MGYTKDYWKRNREKILKERRDRYKNDPEYRQRALQRARERRKKLRDERKNSQKNPVVTLPNGKAVRGYTVTEVSEMTGIPTDKPKYFLRQGYIPAALVSRPKRLYTKNQIQLMKKLDDLLAAHRAALRTPTTEAGMEARNKLEDLITTIHSKWEN